MKNLKLDFVSNKFFLFNKLCIFAFYLIEKYV